MKAYTLRIENQTLNILKYIGIKERKTIRELLLEAIKPKIDAYKNTCHIDHLLTTEEDAEMETVCRILNKCSDKTILQSIQDNRQP